MENAYALAPKVCLMGDESDGEFFSSVTVTKELVQLITSVMEEHNCSGISSIGCGSGFLEWFLANEIGKKVHCVEKDAPRYDSVYPHVAHALEMVFVKGRLAKYDPVPVPDHNILLFVWPDRVRWDEYVQNYRGRAVMFVNPHDVKSPCELITQQTVEKAWNCNVSPVKNFDEFDAVVYARRH